MKEEIIMGIYADYLNNLNDLEAINKERKKFLNKISELRDNRDILVIAADLSKNRVPIAIDYTDILPVHDQLENLSGEAIDIILETPGGIAEVVEDVVNQIRGKYERVGIIIPGYAKSAGTIFTMAGDEILMGPTSALGPVDAQIILANGKRYSADAFLEGIEKIKQVVEETKKLNAAYIPILQNISPGEIQHCENTQSFSMRLVTDWLAQYKFKFWEKHSNGNPVTADERRTRAQEIASHLTSQGEWLTHGRSIKIKDLEKLGIKITNFQNNPDLYDAIMRYYTLLRMTFENSTIYKLFETPNSQIYRHIARMLPVPKSNNTVVIEFSCKKCGTKSNVQANLQKGVPPQPGTVPYPMSNDTLKCPKCGIEHNLSSLKAQIETQTGKKVVE